MDQGTQEEVDSMQKEVDSALMPLKEAVKLLSGMAGSDNKEILQLVRSVVLVLAGVVFTLSMYGRKAEEALQLSVQVITNFDERLCKLEDKSGTEGESQQLHALRKRLARLEKGLQKHDPMLQFLEEWAEAKRDQWFGKGGGTVVER